jgi:hypothetical protein
MRTSRSITSRRLTLASGGPPRTPGLRGPAGLRPLPGPAKGGSYRGRRWSDRFGSDGPLVGLAHGVEHTFQYHRWSRRNFFEQSFAGRTTPIPTGPGHAGAPLASLGRARKPRQPGLYGHKVTQRTAVEQPRRPHHASRVQEIPDLVNRGRLPRTCVLMEEASQRVDSMF